MNELSSSLTEFSSVIVPLSVVLMLSLAVERFIEITRHIMDLVVGISGTRKLPDANVVKRAIDDLEKKATADSTRKSAEEQVENNGAKRQEMLAVLRGDQPTPTEVSQELGKAEAATEWNEQVSNCTLLTLPATDPDDGTTKKVFILQLLAFATGIIFARLFEVDLFNKLLAGHAHFLQLLAGESTVHSVSLVPPSIDYLLTGLLIGGGSKPIHILIRFVTDRKIVTSKIHDVAEEQEPAYTEAMGQLGKAKKTGLAPSAIPSSEVHEWVDIEYHGGVDREVLETVHKRDANPSMIIYHHTAMHSNSTFDDVVRVIKSRDWVTGYNCVVMADGSIKPFCRWDRYGNHAAGYNRKSLGISFNGNFETNPDTPYSNPDGRAGLQRPTEQQLKSGARVVALWTFLYDIKEDYQQCIIPHNQISSKGCPGNNFPHEEFKRWIAFYRNAWSESDYATARIAEFKLKPYLYV